MDNQSEQRRSEQISQDGRHYIQSFLRENIEYESSVFPLESGRVNLIKKKKVSQIYQKTYFHLF